MEEQTKNYDQWPQTLHSSILEERGIFCLQVNDFFMLQQTTEEKYIIHQAHFILLLTPIIYRAHSHNKKQKELIIVLEKKIAGCNLKKFGSAQRRRGWRGFCRSIPYFFRHSLRSFFNSWYQSNPITKTH